MNSFDFYVLVGLIVMFFFVGAVERQRIYMDVEEARTQLADSHIEMLKAIQALDEMSLMLEEEK